MQYTKKIKVKIVLFLIACIFSFSYGNVKSMGFPDKSSIGLDFSELANVVELHRGETYKNYFTVKNTSKIPVTFKAEIMPYTIIGDDGNISFKVNTSETEITKWTQLFWDKEITLAPGEERDISYVIDVPENCKLGEQKETIMLNALTSNEYGIINSNGFLIYATIVDPPLNLPMIIGISVGAVILIGICITIVIVRKNKNKKHQKRNKSKQNAR